MPALHCLLEDVKGECILSFSVSNSLCEYKCQNWILSFQLSFCITAGWLLFKVSFQLMSQIFSGNISKAQLESALLLRFSLWENPRVRELLSQASWVTLHYGSITWTLIKSFHQGSSKCLLRIYESATIANNLHNLLCFHELSTEFGVLMLNKETMFIHSLIFFQTQVNIFLFYV